MDPLAATLVILALMGAVVVLFRAYIRRPIGVARDDPPGVRTVAVFSGDDAQLFADDRPDEPYVGVRLFNALCDGLATAGVSVENRGTIHFAQRAECVLGTERFALVLERAKPRWIASIEWVAQSAAERRHVTLTAQVFAPPDSPQLRQLLTALDRWLQNNPQLTKVQWHRKEHWLAEDTTNPANTPLDPGR